uniref:Transcription factor TFIID n=1 Tax=Marseillevirus LCMAC201 TaxID=2506605 RepID=A0A481YW47_9VIRU|nr:MAG: transcription factor TFIID [Marseillevirus LCMAC201]
MNIVKAESKKMTSLKKSLAKRETNAKLSSPFTALPISTQTVMAYTNCRFNIVNIFNRLPIEDIGDTNMKKINGEHGKIYQLKKAGQVRGAPTKKGHFRNQITAYIYILDKMITVKIFPTGKFHLTGCKNLKHQQQAVVELMNHIRIVHTESEPTFEMDDDQIMNIILEVVMVNIDFHLGFNVDQKKLDQLLQSDNNDFYTIYETPVNTSVNIKLDYPDPEEKRFHKIIIKGSVNKPRVIFTTTSDCPKARINKTRTHTFLVFSSSKVIQSGRYYDSEMEPAYQKFHNFIIKHRNHIELQLQDQCFDMKKLKGLHIASPLQIKVSKNRKIPLS